MTRFRSFAGPFWGPALACLLAVTMLPAPVLAQGGAPPTPVSAAEAERLYREGTLTAGGYFQAPGFRGFEGWYKKPGDPAEWERRLAARPDSPRTAREVRIAGLTPDEYSNLPCDEWLSWWFNRGSGTDAERQAKYDAAHLHPRPDCLQEFRDMVDRGLLFFGVAYNLLMLPITTPGAAGGIYGAGLAGAGSATSRAAAFEAARQAARAAAARAAASGQTTIATAGGQTVVRQLGLTQIQAAESLSPAQAALLQRRAAATDWVAAQIAKEGGLGGPRILQVLAEARRLFHLDSAYPAFLAAILLGSTADAASGPSITDLKLEEEMRTNNGGQGYAPIRNDVYKRPNVRSWVQPATGAGTAELRGQVDVAVTLPPAEFVQPGATLTGRVHVTDKPGQTVQPERLAALMTELTVRIGTSVARVEDGGWFVVTVPSDGRDHDVTIASRGTPETEIQWVAARLPAAAPANALASPTLAAPSAVVSTEPYVVRGLPGDGLGTVCLVGGDAAPLLWKTPLAAGFDVSQAAPGAQAVEIYDGGRLVARDAVAVVTMTASSDRSELKPRERANFEVVVRGLPLAGSGTLGYANQSRRVGRFVGRDHEFVVAIPPAVKGPDRAAAAAGPNAAGAGRTVVDRRQYEGSRPGAFGVQIRLHLSDELTRPRPLAAGAAAQASR